MGVPDPIDMMDHVDCAAVFIDPRVQSERWVYHGSPAESLTYADEDQSLRSDIEVLLSICRRMYICEAGASLVSKLAELSEHAGNNCTPIFAFMNIDLHTDENALLARRSTSRGSWQESSSSNPLRRGFTFSSQNDGPSDLKLLSGLSTDIQVHELPNLVIPVAILRPPSKEPTSGMIDQAYPYSPHPQHISKCLDAGAVDVVPGPVDRVRIQGLVVHAFRIRKTALKEQSRFLSRRKLRKHSWVGVHDEQPYSYLREAMVSKLMKGICNPEDTLEELHDREYYVSPEREEFVEQRLGDWDFTAHEFTDDELVYAAYAMLQHAFSIPELEEWRLTPGELRTFLLACRTSYNSFVLYHNFRHAIDVLQSVFCFLLHIRALPPYRGIGSNAATDCPIASMLKPFDSLTLLIAAIGHDVGHPGVNNFFLVKLNAPLAQLYNDNSVLEAFHCAAFSQILRRYWPAAFKDKQLRKLLISSILATDMGVHQKFMERLGSLQEKYSENDRTTDGWKPQDLEMYKTLVCGLLIKCADISNVARPWEVAEKWTKILQEEFANQGEMEKEVGMETALFGGPPELGNVYKLATGQMGFMSIFALPLFEGVSDILAGLRFTVDHIRSNHTRWHYLADLEKKKPLLMVDGTTDGHVSPRSRSPVATPGGASPLDGATPKAGVTPGSTSSARSRSTQTFPAKEPAQQRKDEYEDYFGPQRSARTSVGSDYNENQISPVVSPDTSGPAVDITGDSYPVEDDSPEQVAAKSPPGVPSGACVPDSGPSSAPEAMSTTVQARNEAQQQGNTVISDSPVDSEQANGARGVYRHHANTLSSSAPSNSQRNSFTRTHSFSTHSNAMSPISPSTNATSVLSADSDENPFSRDIPRSDYADWDSRNPHAKSLQHPRPNTSTGAGTRPGTGTGGTDQRSDTTFFHDDKHSHVHFGNGGGSATGTGTGSSTQSVNTGSTGHSRQWEELGPGPGPDPQHNQQPPQKKLPKRRSRLRLAFWKRKNHSHNGHGHGNEVTGESR